MTPAQRDEYNRALTGARFTMDVRTPSVVKQPPPKAMFDWEVAGGFVHLNNHELGALINHAGVAPMRRANDQYGEKALEDRRRQLQRVVKTLIKKEASEQRAKENARRQAEKEAKAAARARSMKEPPWACNDRLCRHVGPGCRGWADKKRREDAEIAAANAAWADIDANDGSITAAAAEFDDSWALDFDLDGAVATAGSAEVFTNGDGP